ncbi:Rrf2 family transcriptional regulator [Campylobacter suis]|uniref:HTH-type transcriptional regulator YwnA n=1 Tax=Campylobacter suis TaxID=2790657 RepID=A0ABM8Q6I5_9BACT|nr:Rrf2 family transcriptional regulator [Campylobacter suis]CAD7288445.1 Putative HTH-type transcriptional regulator YwnA [Campylobacter suis]
MQVGQKFSIAVHILLSAQYFKDEKNTSEFLADTVGTNPVIVRQIIALLKSSGLIITRAGVGGISLARSASKISLLDIFKAVNGSENLFKIHENSPPACPLGAQIEGLLREHFDSASNALFAHLSSISLQNLLSELE